MFIEPEPEKSLPTSGGAKYALLETKYSAPPELRSSSVSRCYKPFVPPGLLDLLSELWSQDTNSLGFTNPN
jgi:hypothetical protein